jgi:hypothetical protein
MRGTFLLVSGLLEVSHSDFARLGITEIVADGQVCDF